MVDLMLLIIAQKTRPDILILFSTLSTRIKRLFNSFKLQKFKIWRYSITILARPSTEAATAISSGKSNMARRKYPNYMYTERHVGRSVDTPYFERRNELKTRKSS